MWIGSIRVMWRNYYNLLVFFFDSDHLPEWDKESEPEQDAQGYVEKSKSMV